MISMQTLQNNRQVDMHPRPHGYCEECQRQVAEAEREMGAFLTAVERIWGPGTVARAAEYWMKSIESVDPVLHNGPPNWRHATILASHLLATDSQSGRREGMYHR